MKSVSVKVDGSGTCPVKKGQPLYLYEDGSLFYGTPETTCIVRGYLGSFGFGSHTIKWQFASDELVSEHDISWAWVPGHAGVEENERCDELATEAIAKFRAGF